MWELLLNSGTIAQHTSQHILFLRFNKINGGAFHSFLFKQPKPEHHKASLQQNRKTLIIAWSGFILFGWSHESSFWTVADHHLSVVVQWGVIWSRQWQRLLIADWLHHNKGHQKQSGAVQCINCLTPSSPHPPPEHLLLPFNAIYAILSFKTRSVDLTDLLITI